MDKETLRKKALKTRDQIPEAERKKKSEAIIKRLEGLKEFSQAEKILAYFSFGSEVETKESLENWAREKQLYLPRLNEDSSFQALPYGPLKENRYRIAEPAEGIPAKKLDMIILPGLAFDRNGGRLGMGKGYYDRFLAEMKGVLRIALAFQEQVLDSIPLSTYDESVDLIITDCEIIRLQS